VGFSQGRKEGKERKEKEDECERWEG